MSGKAYEIRGIRIFECSGEEPPPRSDKDAVNLISAAAAEGAHFLILPAEWLGDEFFRLKTRVAGEIIQKFVTYGYRAAIVGDISQRVAESSALRDFVYECNQGTNCWFVSSVSEVAERLGRVRPS